MHPLHVLTPLTGREASEQRTVVIGTIELNWRLFVVLVASSPVGVLLAAMLWPFLREYTLLVPPVVMGGAALLFYRRSSKSAMGLRTYQVLLDKRRADDVGKVYLCGYEVDLSMDTIVNLKHNTAPYRPVTSQAEPVVSSNPVVSNHRPRVENSAPDRDSTRRFARSARKRVERQPVQSTVAAPPARPTAPPPPTRPAAPAPPEPEPRPTGDPSRDFDASPIFDNTMRGTRR